MLKFDQLYFLFDTETEGLNHKFSRPWEVSFVIGKGNYIIDRRQIYIDWPDLELSNKVRKLTGFDQGKYDREKISPKEAFEILAGYLYNPEYMIVGQNIIGFDVYIAAILGQLCGQKIADFSFMDRFLDTRCLSTAHKEGLEKPRSGDLISWQYKLRNDRSLKAKVSQGVMLKYFGIDFDPNKLHDGLYDSEKCWELFKCLRKALEL